MASAETFVKPSLPVRPSRTDQPEASLPASSSVAQPCPYVPPAWGTKPADDSSYVLEVLKEGIIVERIPLKAGRHGDNSFVTIGRWSECDIRLDHPSLSRWHAVLQYGNDAPANGWHLYDCDSTHGTICNKTNLPGKQYKRIHVGHVIKFGLSTRQFIVDGPTDDTEPESTKTLTELKAERERRKLIASGVIDPSADGDSDTLFRKARIGRGQMPEEVEKEEHEARTKEIEAGSWGIRIGDGTDGLGEDDREEFYMSDPKKALQHFFDREGYEMNFEFEEKGSKSQHDWVCKINLPLGASDEYVQAVTPGSKKQGMKECALAACRLLDSLGLLRAQKGTGETENIARAKALHDNDYLSSDEDIYLDRTGELDAKRSRRKRRIDALLGVSELAEKRKKEAPAVRYEHLREQITENERQRDILQRELDSLHAAPIERPVNANDDALDVYMYEVKKADESAVKGALDIKVRKTQLRQQICQRQHEIERLSRLAKVARPAELPKINKLTGKLIKDEPAASSSVITTATTMADADYSVARVKEQPEPDTNKTRKTIEDLKKEFEQEKIEMTVNENEPTKVYSMEIPEHILKAAENAEEPKSSSDEETVVVGEDESGKKTKRKQRHRNRDRRRMKPVTEEQLEQIATIERRNDPVKFATWVPPSAQTGDGRTSLNDKLGY